MNWTRHHQIIIDFDVWAPFDKQALKEIDDIILGLKERKLLAHCGNVRSRILDGKEIQASEVGDVGVV